ncbi:MAG: membrane protein insertase YidC [Blastochloris viridis]|uniref:Membrane protein insertase YidC n=1 Tax=Blastochloris viridis TaxID=1079 RepID=A0A6N4RBF4_BLAVI|nr:MAG: membrane protein insertase YidC [Blastochloris viridis]
MMKKDDKGLNNRMIWALAASASILLVSDWAAMRFFGTSLAGANKPAIEKVATVAAEQGATPVVAAGTVSGTEAVAPVQAVRVSVGNERVDASINTQGARLDMLTLKSYKGEIDDPEGFTFLKPTGKYAEYVAAGWAGAGIEGPGENAVWQVEGDSSAGKPVIMIWRNASGQVFQREVSMNPDSYVMNVVERVYNGATLPVSLTPYVQVHRADGYWPNERSNWVNYFGPMGVVEKADDGFQQYETKYSKLKDDGKSDVVEGKGGWWGITSQYFLTAILPGDLNGAQVDSQRQFRFKELNVGGTAQDVYTASVSWPNVVVGPNETKSVSYQLYVGPKHYGQLQAAGHELDRAISWGWFGPLVKGLYHVLAWIHGYVHNWGLAVIGLTILLKLATFPLANKSYHAMAKMRRLQPKMEDLKAKHKDNQQALATEMMALYKREKVNPMGGCWPMLIQIPIFFAMYKVVLVMFEFRHAPLGLWITDMSVHDPLYVLPVLMGISMWAQFKMNPAPADPTQAIMFKWMPAFMTVMFLWFPAGLVLYWLTNNILSVGQQYFIMKKDKAL